MIVEFIMWLLAWVIELLPDWTPLGIASDYVANLVAIGFVSDALGIMMWLDHYFPVGEAMDLLGYTILALGIGWAYSGIMWIWRNLPGKAT